MATSHYYYLVLNFIANFFYGAWSKNIETEYFVKDLSIYPFSLLISLSLYLAIL